MTISYTDFKKKYPIGSSVGKPFPPYDYVGECVSFVLHKMTEVDGAPIVSPLGHAAQIPHNDTFKEYYESVPASERQIGDLMFWENDQGNWTGDAGHTAIYDGNDYMYNQNFNSSGKVSRDKIFTPGFIGYFRRKGGTMSKPNTQQLHDMGTAAYRAIYDREPESGKAAIAMGKKMVDEDGELTPASFISGVQGERKADEWKQRSSKAKSTKATVLKKGTYIVK